MNVESYDLDSLRRLVRSLQSENESLKEKLRENAIPFEEVDVFAAPSQAPDEHDPDQSQRAEPIAVTDLVARRFFSRFWCSSLRCPAPAALRASKN